MRTFAGSARRFLTSTDAIAVSPKRRIPTIGDRFGRWTVIGDGTTGSRSNVLVPCRCDCGTEKLVNHYNLLRSKSTSCGCYERELKSARSTTHGDSGTPLYGVWLGINKRCHDSNEPAYRDYGGRGIAVCEAWRADYTAFRDWALGHGYREGLEIDRRDNAGGYDPDNCRFVTRRENQRNKRTNRIVEAFGESKTLADWADDARCHVSYGTLYFRLKRGWEPEHAMRQPSRSVREFLSSDTAIAVTEYGLLVALVAVLLIGVIAIFGSSIASWFSARTGTITSVGE